MVTVFKYNKMDENFLLAIIGAIGIKEIWVIIKKRMDLNAKKEERGDNITVGAIGELSLKIEELEKKINSLIEENTDLKVKLARMEERILLHAKNSVKKTNGKRKKI
tara:strand:+ start:802 stop:1122 length:321 start_codon:yes stop_codon:yes gene_type:complete